MDNTNVRADLSLYGRSAVFAPLAAAVKR
jgi:hypothetical protein